LGEVTLKQVNVSQFLRQYESEATRKNYFVALKQFFKLMYPGGGDLDELSERYLREDRDYRDDLLRFKESMKGRAPSSKTVKIYAVRAYLSDNNIQFPRRFFKKLNGRSSDAISAEDVPSNEQLKKICEYLPVHGKALALLLASSGMRIGEAIELQIDDVELDREPARITIPAEITKNKKKRITFLTPEAVDAIEEWLTYRGQYVQQAGGRSARHKRDNYDGRLFPFSVSNFNEIWNRGLEKAGLLTKDPRTHRVTMRPHNLRKFFRLRVGRFGRDEVEALIGHQQGLHAIYARFVGQAGEQRLEDIYSKAIPELCAVDAKSYQLRGEIATKQDQFETAIANLSLENSALKGRLKKAEEGIANLQRAVDVIIERHKHQIENLRREFDSQIYELTDPERIATNAFWKRLLDTYQKQRAE
jgi:integrase